MPARAVSLAAAAAAGIADMGGSGARWTVLQHGRCRGLGTGPCASGKTAALLVQVGQHKSMGGKSSHSSSTRTSAASNLLPDGAACSNIPLTLQAQGQQTLQSLPREWAGLRAHHKPPPRHLLCPPDESCRPVCHSLNAACCRLPALAVPSPPMPTCRWGQRASHKTCKQPHCCAAACCLS